MSRPEMNKRPGQPYQYDLPAPDIDITKTSVWKTRKPGTSGPDFDVLCAQNTIIAKQNQEILRLLFSLLGNGYNEKPVKPHIVAAEQLLAHEESRQLLLVISRKFEDTGRGRMSSRRTEIAKVIHGPAWQSFVIGNLEVEDSRKPYIGKMKSLFKDMTSASMMQVHTRVSRILRAEEESNDDDMGAQDASNHSEIEGGSQDAYDLSDSNDMAVQDTELLSGIDRVVQDGNKPNNVQKRPPGQTTHFEQKMATPPETPAATSVPRSATTQIINGEIMIVPKKKVAKKPRTMSKAPAKVVAKPGACGISKASTQNSNLRTETTVQAGVGKENGEPEAKRRRMDTCERAQDNGSESVVNVSSAESESDLEGDDC